MAEEGMLDKAKEMAKKAKKMLDEGTEQAQKRVAETAEKAKLADELRPKLGLNYSEMGQFMIKADAARSGAKIPELYKQNKNGYDGLLSALGRAYKKDNDILAKLDAEMTANPGLEDRFYKAIKKEPNAFAAKLGEYKSGDLKSFVEQTEQASPSPAALVAGTAKEVTGSPIAKTEKPAPAPAAKPTGKQRVAKPAASGAVGVAAAAIDEGDAEIRGCLWGLRALSASSFQNFQRERLASEKQSPKTLNCNGRLRRVLPAIRPLSSNCSQP